MKQRTVLDLEIGEVGYVKSFNDLHYACRLLTLGVLPKTKVTLVRKSPFRDALYLQLEDHKIAIRKSEGAVILLEDK